jgi:hypothetical protein
LLFEEESAVEVPLMMYPNPASSLVNLTIEGSVMELVNVFTLEGKMLSTVAVNASFYVMNLESMPPGVYLIHTVMTDGSERHSKLIVE